MCEKIVEGGIAVVSVLMCVLLWCNMVDGSNPYIPRAAIFDTGIYIFEYINAANDRPPKAQ